MILLPEEIIELILSYAPDYRDNLKRCQKELLSNHRPVYYKKVHAGFEPIADSPTWHNFKRNDEIKVWRRGNIYGPMEYMKLKLYAIEITPERTSPAERERYWHNRDINLYYGWSKISNKELWNIICEWNSENRVHMNLYWILLI